MRAFTKAAALLSCARALSSAIPEPASLDTPPLGTAIEYNSRDTSLTFEIDGLDKKERLPAFTFQVQGTNRACGESHVLLNGLKLHSEWDGTHAHGQEYLDIYGGKEAEWYISCIFNTLPANGHNSNGEDVIHVLSLRVGSSHESVSSGFTISYKQMDQPAILRFQPKYSPINSAGLPDFVRLWRSPSLEFDPEIIENGLKDTLFPSLGSIGRAQKSLGIYLQALEGSLKKGFKGIIQHLCPKHKAQSKGVKPQPPFITPPHRLLEPPPTAEEVITTSTDTSDSTNTVPNFSAAETRSLTALQSFDPSTAPTSAPSIPPQSDHNLHLLRIFALVLICSSCIAWICLRCRDPRRRAECLARREERRNKKLYRRAARQHKVKMWFWNFRLKYGLLPSDIIEWDEKRIRVLEQENVLEDAMTDDIRALRNAHRVVSSITAAEEGRIDYVYDSERSERRHSVATLPGYESEGSQPPTYENSGGIFGCATVVDGFQYASAEAEFRSDSSVISTSPRISRDGTSSDLDEKFEVISLETT